MTTFPDKAYGRSAHGHNPAPSGATNNATSTNQISEGEEQLLFWSPLLQEYVDWITFKTQSVGDREPGDEARSQKLRDDEEFRARAGFVTTIG